MCLNRRGASMCRAWGRGGSGRRPGRAWRVGRRGRSEPLFSWSGNAGTMGGMEHTKLSRADASAAVTGLGWRYVLGEFRTQVLTGSLPLAADVAGRAAALPDVEGHLRMDIRADRLLLSLQTAEQAWVTTRDAELARQLSALAQEFRLTTQPGDRTVQALELGIDALDIGKVRPFWKAALGYADEPEGGHGLVDPLGQGPA